MPDERTVARDGAHERPAKGLPVRPGTAKGERA